MDHMFAFTARSLIPALLSSFFLDLAQKVVVESFPIDGSFVTTFLQPSIVLARHTSVVHLKKGIDKGSKYVWAHRDMQPWGTPLPAQCPNCKTFRPWGPRKSGKDKVATFRCQGKYNKSDCNYLFVASIPSNVVHTTNDWMTVEWPPVGENMI
jgi:hypothetical protein